MCFFRDRDTQVGSEIRYIWVSDTYPNFAGRAAQEGGQIKMFGGEATLTPSFNDAMQFEIVTASPANLAAGHWHEWTPASTYANTVAFTSATMLRDGPCPYATPEDALDQTPMRVVAPNRQSPIGPSN